MFKARTIYPLLQKRSRRHREIKVVIQCLWLDSDSVEAGEEGGQLTARDTPGTLRDPRPLQPGYSRNAPNAGARASGRQAAAPPLKPALGL